MTAPAERLRVAAQGTREALIDPDITEALAVVFETTADSLDRFHDGLDGETLLSPRDQAVLALAGQLLGGAA